MTPKRRMQLPSVPYLSSPGGPTSRRGFLVGALGLTGAALLAACGDDDDPSGGGTADGDTGSTGGTSAGTGAAGGGTAAGGTTAGALGILPITDVAPFFLGQKLGYFEEEGISISHTFAAGGAVILPSVESGEFDVGYSNIVSLLLLQSRGGKFKLVAGGGKTATGDKPDYSQMWVLNDSPLESLADLPGKKVAINTLKNALEIVTRAAVEEAGGDHDSIQFVEIPFPDMGAALEGGQVDAILYNEPFQTILAESGTARIIGQPFNVAAGGEILAYYFVKAENAEAQMATGFGSAMKKANGYAADNEDELRQIITTYSEVPKEIADKLIMPPYVEDSIPESSLKVYAELMTKYGLVDEVPDYTALLL